MNKLLSKILLVIAITHLFSFKVFANQLKLNVYGLYVGGAYSHHDTKISRNTKTLKAEAAGITLGPENQRSFFDVTSHNWQNNNALGFHLQLSQKVSAVAEIRLTASEEETATQQHHIQVNLKQGHLLLGAHTLLYAEIAQKMDGFQMAHANQAALAGIGYQQFEEALTYKSEALGWGHFGISFVRSSNPGSQKEGGSESPILQALVGVQGSQGDWRFGADAVVHSESFSFQKEEEVSEYTSETGTVSLLNVWMEYGTLKAYLGHSRGVDIFSNTLQTASPQPNMKADYQATTLWLEHMWRSSFLTGVYLSTERGDSGMPGAQEEVGRSHGLQLGYYFYEAQWLLEWVETTESYDSTITRNIKTLVLGAKLTWDSDVL